MRPTLARPRLALSGSRATGDRRAPARPVSGADGRGDPFARPEVFARAALKEGARAEIGVLRGADPERFGCPGCRPLACPAPHAARPAEAPLLARAPLEETQPVRRPEHGDLSL